MSSIYNNTICKSAKDVTQGERIEIIDLYLKYYDGSNPEQVSHDLNNKTDIILMKDHDAIVGFTTLECYERVWKGKRIKVIYSGDTIVEKDHWGQQALTFACISRMGEYKNADPDIPTYWFIIVKGHRTFKYLPVFMNYFYPHWEYQSQSLKEIAEYLVTDKFGSLYNSETGVIEFPQSKGHLKKEYAYPNDNEKKKPSVKYFLERNPRYNQGHELVCLCELSDKYMKPLTRRVFDKNMGYPGTINIGY